MIRPMMVMTTSISTSVKPRCPSSSSAGPATKIRPIVLSDIMMNRPVFDLVDELRDRQQSGHDRHDQSADDRADGDDGKRSDDADDAVEAALQFRFIEFGNPARQRRQLPGFLAQA